MKRLLAFVLSLGFSSAASAAFINGSFETGGGSFAGWSTIGATSVIGAFGTELPTDGAFQATLLTNQSPGDAPTVTDAAIEAFFSIPLGSIDASIPGFNATNGSAISQVLTLTAGDTISFDMNFLSNDVPPFNPFIDTAFAIISDGIGGFTVSPLLDVFDATNPGTGGLAGQSGYINFSSVVPASGTFIFGVAVFNVGDNSFRSQILVDNFQVIGAQVDPVPAPPALLLGLAGIPVVAAIRRRGR